MKKFYTTLCLVIASLTQLQAQAPQGFNYQATVRNSAGDLVVSTNVYFKFNIIQGAQTQDPVFTETHYVPTDDLGQINLVIGQGIANTGTFTQLDWSQGSYYLGIELDTGNGYVTMGTTQLLSVPYALYAENSGNATSTTPNLEAVLVENNSANNQQIKDLQDPTEAQDAVTKNYTYSKEEVDALIVAAVNNLNIQINENLNLLEFLKGKVYRKDIPDGVRYVHFDLSYLGETIYEGEPFEQYDGWSFYEIYNDSADEQGCFLQYPVISAELYALRLNPTINSPTEFKFDAAFGQSWDVIKNLDDTIRIYHDGGSGLANDDGYTEVTIEEFIALDCF